MTTPADLARAAIASADAVEEAWQQAQPADYSRAAELLHDARCDARAAGLVECWMSRETVEAVREWTLSGIPAKWHPSDVIVASVARDLAAND